VTLKLAVSRSRLSVSYGANFIIITTTEVLTLRQNRNLYIITTLKHILFACVKFLQFDKNC